MGVKRAKYNDNVEKNRRRKKSIYLKKSIGNPEFNFYRKISKIIAP
jgi:hypothetical protein